MALYLDGGAGNYKSAAIRVVKSADLNQDAATPVLDVAAPSTQSLQAIVNTTAAIAGVKVQLWAMAFGTGSTPYLNSFGGTTGVELPAGIGTSMQANTPQTFGRAWDESRGLTVADPEIPPLLGANSEFHCCIKANVFAVIEHPEGGESIIEGQRLGPSPTLDLNDPHQAQRNMTIKTHAAGTAMKMKMFAGNTHRKRKQSVKLIVQDRPLERLPRLELAELGTVAPWIQPGRGRFGAGVVPGLHVELDGERRPIRLAERPLDDLALTVGDVRGSRLELVLPPGEPHAMTLSAQIGKDEFVLHSIDVAQVEDDELVGEAHVLLLSVPQALVASPAKRRLARA